MLKPALLALLLVSASVGLAGCASDAGDDDGSPVASDEEDLLKKTGPTSNWSYRGLLPTLDQPQLTVSLKGHTVHATGLLPTTFTGKLPFYVKTTPEGARTRVHVAYPIATVDPNGRFEDGTRTRNPEPFRYAVCGGDNFHATNKTGAFGGFPFIEYVCSHRDADGRMRGGIAFHGPITTTSTSGGASYWSLVRGPVSHACNRMLGEHVLELAHVIGFDKGKRGMAVNVIADFDRLGDKIIDVDYASTGWTRPAATASVVFPIWQAVKLRSDGSTALDFPQWACESSRCASMPDNARDPYTGEPVAR
ncbi:MAG: hypothetical protein JWP97_3937 [Labilithrix sp.]|nr:hypothetical protein [Labilithrix sp.]